MSDHELFWRKVRKTEGCWLWLASKDRDGYGRFLRGRAHRFAYELLVRPIPEGLQLDHLCRNPSCINPDHLEVVTSRENTLRGNGPAARQARQTHCKNGHEFTPENTYLDGRGGRTCRICRRRRHTAYMRARRAAA